MALSLIERAWYRQHPLAYVLLPLSWLFGLVTLLRRTAFRIGLFRTRRFDTPVIIVGNISVGGTGKTPLVAWLCDYLQGMGFKPGIVSRGYGGRARHWPQQVRPDSDTASVGDEAVMLAERTQRPMCVGPDRPAAVEALLEHTDVDIVISDDGLQHYALARNMEIVVVDGERRFGNGWLLPAGPLRESKRRLGDVDLVIVNGQGRQGEHSMALSHTLMHSLDGRRSAALEGLRGKTVHAIAGIGNPERFFELLRRNGLTVRPHAFPDHHVFRSEDVCFEDEYPVLMTEKDAVKCRRMPCDNCWVVRVDAQPDAAFVHRLTTMLKAMIDE